LRLARITRRMRSINPIAALPSRCGSQESFTSWYIRVLAESSRCQRKTQIGGISPQTRHWRTECLPRDPLHKGLIAGTDIALKPPTTNNGGAVIPCLSKGNSFLAASCVSFLYQHSHEKQPPATT
jgi:hypothetical protein